ncbi:MAG: septal ring lytic transglycosylase RlpA family protein [Polaromonas sp.]|nr:septal ring lytic transglycosylase RlpA family protein [Polaromonas sp.]
MVRQTLTGLLLAVAGLLGGCASPLLQTQAVPTAQDSESRPVDPAPAAQAEALGPATTGTGTSPDPASGLSTAEPPFKQAGRGKASWYGPGFHGRRTANGERYDQHAMTAAHKSLPFGTRVRVQSLVNGREVDVRINDRGPFKPGRVIDLSRSAAQALDMLGLGVKEVLLLVPEATVLAGVPAKAVRPRLRVGADRLAAR